jgi:diguanylate cyclase (GGDEF)-like protein
VSARRTLYALAGAVLGLGAPAGLLGIRLMRRGPGGRSIIGEIRNDPETYVYTAASTSIAFALFGGILGRYADRLARLATTDPLTDLSNARVFHERLRQELGRVDRSHESLSLLILDLDSLKRINDHYGHQAGDEALRSVADAIRNGLREIDLGARLGGDEFGVLAPRTNAESALVLGERLRALVRTHDRAASDLGATVSIGIVSLVPSRGERPTPGALMAAADEALYQAKREGGDRVALRQDGGFESSSSWARRYS